MLSQDQLHELKTRSSATKSQLRDALSLLYHEGCRRVRMQGAKDPLSLRLSSSTVYICPETGDTKWCIIWISNCGKRYCTAVTTPIPGVAE